MAVLAMRDALNQALREEMKRDESVFLLGEDIGLYDGSFKVTRGLMKEFGEKRVLDTPIAEEIIIGTAIGAAMSGLRPVAEMMTVNFAPAGAPVPAGYRTDTGAPFGARGGGLTYGWNVDNGVGMRITDITDGSSNTMLLGEKHVRPDNFGKFAADDFCIYISQNWGTSGRKAGPKG